MKPREKKPERVFRIISKENFGSVVSYSRACCDEFDFTSVNEARRANCHRMFEDKDKYDIAEYEVTYKLINKSCD